MSNYIPLIGLRVLVAFVLGASSLHIEAQQDAKGRSSASLYGIEIGRPLPAARDCGPTPLGANERYCYASTQIALDGAMRENLKKVNVSQRRIILNQSLFDTSTLFANPLFGVESWVDLVVSPDNVVRSISVQTDLRAANAVKINLDGKFGKPTEQSKIDWLDDRTGQVSYSTPRYVWQTKDFMAVFDAKAPIAASNPKGDRGELVVYDDDFLARLQKVAREAKANRPGM